MKKHLFYTFLLLFVVIVVITLLGIANVLHIKVEYLTPLVTIVLAGVGGAVIGIYKKVDFFEEEEKKTIPIEETYNNIDEPTTKAKANTLSEKRIDISSIYENPTDITMEEYFLAIKQLDGRFNELRRFSKSLNGVEVNWKGFIQDVSEFKLHTYECIHISIKLPEDLFADSALIILGMEHRTDAFSCHKGDFINVKGVLDLSSGIRPTIKASTFNVINCKK
ncbi:hypothetical protein [Francisella uliginis]|uniref:Uncharacterized protein n=1 Tax=Francisella uliginis TaxID=573570 RepID=A0A1L4BV11_9GAMM|nr:hypothetical protein [Francisella uliginis]API87684.1 hypothetical protein F7310_10120 [Francisella uliginis]